MKNMIFGLSLVIVSLAACSKSGTDDNGSGNATIVPASAVPVPTINAFNTAFSGTSGVEWERHSSSSFTVQFNQSSQRHSAGFDDNGHQSSHSVICTDGAVPQVVLDAFRSGFSNDSVYEWNLRNDGSWKAHFMRGPIKYEATFTAAGALIKFERA